MNRPVTQWTAARIRSQFLDFFKERHHHIVPSAPIVLKGDPTLMFTNAGMNQFKENFLGNATLKHLRVADTQKCLRVSGKHNDLEEVGRDTYHHTMFEMLGNWSFGDYFKKEAIAWAWELLTEVYQIDKDKLYVTVYEGDSEDNLSLDTEAQREWEKYIAPHRILKCDKKDNFWEMGATGPCGPSSEIHIDLRSEAERKKTPGITLVNRDHPLVVEIWNLVFIEYNRLASGKLEKLPTHHVDTGMGLERLCMALQGVYSNYDTDVFTPLIKHIEEVSRIAYGSEAKADVAMRVVADHCRAVAFTIADGQLPSNNGAGYVIRRILRRAIRYTYTDLNIKEPFIYSLVKVLRAQMETFFPEIAAQQHLVEKVIKEEEESFLRTLEQGLNRLNQLIFQAEDKKIDGSKVFELYDTYGFPPDLTALILREKGLYFRQTEFDREMQAQKERARGATKVDTGDWQIIRDENEEEFIGYDHIQCDVHITRVRKITKKNKELYQLVFNNTPFYPEGGGQVGDTGEIDNGEEKIKILDTKKEHNLILHIAEQLPQNITAPFQARVNPRRRYAAAENHSATHLLHKALREILGDHVEQKGSLVHPDYLRFDFSHFTKVSEEELKQIEDRVNDLIQQNHDLEEFRNIPMEEAQGMGAMALFNEKYGDMVRVIKYGDSIELCGGTHVKATGEIGVFAITTETAVASGIRRIEAVTGQGARAYYRRKLELLEQLQAEIGNPKSALEGLNNIKKENNRLKKELATYVEAQTKAEKEKLRKAVTVNGDYNLLIAQSVLAGGELKNVLFQLRGEIDNLAAVVATDAQPEKPQIAIIFDENLAKAKGWHAGKLVKTLAAEIKGGGGGQPGFAMAGGKDAAGIDRALTKAAEILNA